MFILGLSSAYVFSAAMLFALHPIDVPAIFTLQRYSMVHSNNKPDCLNFHQHQNPELDDKSSKGFIMSIYNIYVILVCITMEKFLYTK